MQFYRIMYLGRTMCHKDDCSPLSLFASYFPLLTFPEQLFPFVLLPNILVCAISLSRLIDGVKMKILKE